MFGSHLDNAEKIFCFFFINCRKNRDFSRLSLKQTPFEVLLGFIAMISSDKLMKNLFKST